jgi:hypothetical protein
MRKICGINRPEGRLDGRLSAGHEEGYVEKFPSNQALGLILLQTMDPIEDIRMSLRNWFERNENVLKAVAALVVALSAGAWAIFELLYPDLIQPRLEPGKLQVDISEVVVGRTEQYSAHQLTFTLKNKGINRIYIPSSYFLVKAHRVVRVGAKKAEGITEEEKQKEVKIGSVVKNFLQKMSKEEVQTLQAQASNFIVASN